MNSKSKSASADLLSPAADAEPAPPPRVGVGDTVVAAEPEAHSTGILPFQELEHLVRVGKDILAADPIQDDQIQPASLDLRLGSVAYRVRASFLPGKSSTVLEKLEQLAMHKMDITNGAVLERGCVYIVPLLEHVALRHRMSAMANPKSSTGRLNVFTRLITDHGTEFDRVRERYRGPLFAEISPRTFSVLVRKGSRLNQLRVRRGNPPNSDEALRRLQAQVQLVTSDVSDEDIRDNGVPITVDVRGEQSGGVIGFKARAHSGLIDMDRERHYEINDFWETIHAPPRGGLVLDPADFYILASDGAVRVPSSHAAELIASDTLVGEFRVHYAGFFDPGFGDPEAGGAGARAVLEVRSYEVPFVVEHGQTVGRLVYERLTSAPSRLYGQGLRSSYQRQGIALSKHFKPWTGVAR